MLRMEEVFRQYDREFLKSRTTPNFKESKVNEGSMARAVTRITTLQTEIDEMVAPMQINLKKSRPWEDIAHIRQSSSAESIRGALMLVKFGDDAIKQVPNIMAALGNLPSILKFVMGEKEAMVSIDEHINEKERMDTLKTAVEQPLQKSWRQRYLESDKYKNSKQYKRIQLKTKAANKEILEYTAKYTFGPMTTEVMRNKVMRDAEFLYLQKQVARMKTTVTKRIPGGRSNPAAVELDRGIDNELLYKHQMLESDAINAQYEHRTGLMATMGEINREITQIYEDRAQIKKANDDFEIFDNNRRLDARARLMLRLEARKMLEKEATFGTQQAINNTLEANMALDAS